MTGPPDRVSKRRFLRYVAAVLVVAIIGGALGMRWLDRETSAELADLRTELRAQGAPLGYAEVFGVESTESSELTAWLEEFSEARSPRWRPGDAGAADGAARLTAVREEAEALGLSAELDLLEECLESEGAERLYALALEPDATVEDVASLSDCERELARLLTRLDPGGLAVAARAGELPHLRVSDFVEEDRPAAGTFFPQPPAVELLMVVQRLAVAAELAALAGDAQASARYLEAGFRAATIVRDLPWLMPLLLWSAAESQMLEALRQSLPGLPADADLGRIARHLEVLRPLELTRTAVIGERAMTDGFLEAMENGELEEGALTQLDGGLRVPSWFSWSLKRDHLHYLRESEAFLADLERPWPEVREGLSRPKRSSGKTVDWLRSAWPDVFEQAVVLDSERLKALAALRAHRMGVKSTRIWLEGQRDPLTNRPFRRREEPGEVWILEAESDYAGSHDWRLRRGAP